MNKSIYYVAFIPPGLGETLWAARILELEINIQGESYKEVLFLYFQTMMKEIYANMEKGFISENSKPLDLYTVAEMLENEFHFNGCPIPRGIRFRIAKIGMSSCVMSVSFADLGEAISPIEDDEDYEEFD